MDDNPNNLDYLEEWDNLDDEEKLKRLKAQAENYLKTHSFKDLIKTRLWTSASVIIWELKKNKDGIVNCPYCGGKFPTDWIDGGQLYHYKPYDLFNPNKTDFYHRECYLHLNYPPEEARRIFLGLDD